VIVSTDRETVEKSARKVIGKLEELSGCRNRAAREPPASMPGPCHVSMSDLPILLIIVRVTRSFRFLVTRHHPAAALAGIKEKGLRVDRRVVTGRLDDLWGPACALDILRPLPNNDGPFDLQPHIGLR
jgi:hypothetical protein